MVRRAKPATKKAVAAEEKQAKRPARAKAVKAGKSRAKPAAVAKVARTRRAFKKTKRRVLAGVEFGRAAAETHREAPTFSLANSAYEAAHAA